MNPRNLFAELKQRNGYKVAISYALLGWFVAQPRRKVDGVIGG
jgi:hypothetical protein